MGLCSVVRLVLGPSTGMTLCGSVLCSAAGTGDPSTGMTLSGSVCCSVVGTGTLNWDDAVWVCVL